MAESEYIKIKRSDLKEALLAAFEAGWSGTPEVAESIALTIIAGMTSNMSPAMDESLIIQRLSDMMGSVGDKMYYTKSPWGRDPIYELGKKTPTQFVQQQMHDEWDMLNT